jgi:glycosyltransferase involved in cell wall biosynthesis
MALVAVIIPTRNMAEFIELAIDSVLEQTFTDLELFVVDDGSTDRTQEIVEAYSSRDSRVKYIGQTQAGPSAARNKGILASSAPYIAVLDADDYWVPDKLTAQMRVIELQNVGLVMTGAEIRHQVSGLVEYNACTEADLSFQKLLQRIPGGSLSSALIRRRCLEEVGLFNEKLYVAEDLDLWLRISLSSWKMMAVNEALVVIRRRPVSQSNGDYQVYLGGHLEVYKWAFSVAKENGLGVGRNLQKYMMAAVYRNAAWGAQRKSCRMKGISYLYRACLYQPSLLEKRDIQALWLMLILGSRYNFIAHFAHKLGIVPSCSSFK